MARRSNTVRVARGASACGAEPPVVTRSDNSAAKHKRLLLMASPCALQRTVGATASLTGFRLRSLAPAGPRRAKARLRNDAAIEQRLQIVLGLLICQLLRITPPSGLVALVRHVLPARRSGWPLGNGQRTDAGNRDFQ